MIVDSILLYNTRRGVKIYSLETTTTRLMTPANRELLGTLLILVSAVSFGMMPIFARYAYAAGVGVGELLFLRFLFASLIMAIFLGLTGKFIRPKGRKILILLALGGIAYFLQATLYFTSLTYVPVSLVALILYSYPAFVTAASISLRWERLSRRILASLILALVGVVFVANAGASFKTIGILMAVGAAITYSIYILAGSRALKGMSGEAAILYVMVGATISFALSDLITGNLQFAWQPEAWTWIVLITIVCTCIAATTFFQGLRLVGPARGSILSVLEPLTAIIVASILFGELLNLQQWIGGLLIVGAVLVTASGKAVAPVG